MRTAVLVFCLGLGLVAPLAAQAESDMSWDTKALTSGLKQFFGKLKGNHFYKGALVWEEVATGGVTNYPSDVTALKDGTYLIEGYRVHSATERAAAVVRKPNQILAAALIHYDCGGKDPNCADKPILTMYFHGAADAKLKGTLSDWGNAQEFEDSAGHTIKIKKTEIKILK